MMKKLLLLVAVLALVVAGCQSAPTTPPMTYSVPELEYRVIANFDNVFWCDTDIYPIEQPGREQANALDQFPAISADTAEFSAILAHLGIARKATYTDDEKLQIYREHKLLTYAVQFAATTDPYEFTLRVGEGDGERIDGTVTSSGVITVTHREPSFNTCPICLSQDTLVDTPDGPVPVEQLQPGMTVWTAAADGSRVPAVIVTTGKTPVPAFEMVKLTLADGRSVTASPGHPAADGRPLGVFEAGDNLDGARVVSVAAVTYTGGFTYDLLPAGPTGTYWANGILLGSTLAPH